MDFSGGISAITVIARDLAATRRFYAEALGLPVYWEDDSSAVFQIGRTLLNVLADTAAPELIEPAVLSTDPTGVTAVYTIEVADIDVAADELRERGIELLNGPVTRPWGPRTVSFRDPAGTVWELATN